MSFHKLECARDKNFWSVRASGDLRLIVHRVPDSLLLCYVDHHDKAYDWAERRKLETHPKTGAAQLVEIRETVQEIVVPAAAPRSLASGPRLFAGVSDDELLGYGVPAEWLADARHANEDSLFDLAEHLPAEAAEALLILATGGRPEMRATASLTSGLMPSPGLASIAGDPFEHPDAQRRFRVVNDVEELERARDSPGIAGWCSFTPRSAQRSNAITPAPPGSRVQRGPGRPSLPSIVPPFSAARTLMLASCSLPFRTRSPTLCVGSSDA